jgi:hypothetical protein
MDSMTAIGNVRVTKTDIETGEVVFDQTFKNQITNFARSQVAAMWTGQVVPVPTQIAVGTGSNPTGTSPADIALWSEVSGSRQNVDYATIFLNYYTQYAVTYQQTDVLQPVLNFSDALTEYTGSSATGWTVGGTVIFDANGATMGGPTSASILSTVATGFDPSAVNGPVTFQATFKTATNLSGNSVYMHLYQDSNNFYEVYLGQGQLKIGKTISGTHSVIGGSNVTITASTTYTIWATIDSTGLITANVYAGVGTGGTLLATVSFTDTSLPGPYSLRLGGEVNAVISNAQATYPNPDTTQQITLSEAGLFDDNGNLWSHVQLNGVTHDNTTTLSIQWQILQQGN